MSLRNCFVLPIVLLAFAFLAGCGGSGTSITNPVAPPSGGFGKSSLNGTYVFSVSGTDNGGLAYAIVGSFTANGSGSITAGTVDINDGAFAPIPNSAVSGGTYTVGVDGRGQAQLNTSTPFKTIVLDFVLQDSTHGLATEFDNNASGTGTLDQGTGASPAGSYAFILSGAYGSSGASPVPLVTVGNFTLGSGGAVSGLEDFNSAVIAYPNETLSGTVVAGPSSTPGSQLIAVPSGSATPQYTITYDVYPVDASHLKFIEMDASGTLSGDAFAQSSTAMPTNSSLAFTLLGGSSSPTSVTAIATGGIMVTDANGNITNTSSEDINNTGTFSPAPTNFSGTTTAGGTGRYTLALTGFAAGTQYAAYPSSAGLLLLEIDNSGMMAGNALTQSSTAALATSQGYALNLSGTNLGGATGSTVEVDDIAEFATSSSGTNLTGVTDENFAPGGNPNYALALSGNYNNPDTSGRGQLAANAGNSNNGTLNGGFSLTYYSVDGSSFPFIESDNGQVTVGVFVKQNSSASAAAGTRSHVFVMPPIARPRLARQHN